jgi:nucleoside-diphosphate-sugar epimerase
MTQVHVVVGANGGAGHAVVKALAARGLQVRAVTRNGRGNATPGVEPAAGEALDATSMKAVCRDAAVVYNCVNVPYPQWRIQLPRIAEVLTAAAGAAGARLVLMDNLYMYSPVDGLISETTPRRPPGPKGRLRLELEEYYLEAHRRGRVRVAIGRASDFYGLQANSMAMILGIHPALRGRRAQWVGTLDAPHTLNYLPDVGAALAVLGEHDEALGEIWHLPAAEPLTGRQFLELVFETIGRPRRIGLLTRPMMRLASVFSPTIREVVEVLYQFERPFVVDASKFVRAFGRQVTPHQEAVRQVVGALRSR